MSNQSEGFAGLPQHLQPSNLPAQEPSATPSTLELERMIIAWEEADALADHGAFAVCARELRAALRPSEGPPQVYRAQDGRLPELEIVASEGPETGRPPASMDRLYAVRKRLFALVDSLATVSNMTKELGRGIAEAETAVREAALPAGPETGDRERLRELLHEAFEAGHWAWPTIEAPNRQAMFQRWLGTVQPAERASLETSIDDEWRLWKRSGGTWEVTAMAAFIERLWFALEAATAVRQAAPAASEGQK